MKRQKKMSDFSWPFSRHRQTWIDNADRLTSEAAEKFESAIFETGDRTRTTVAKKAAKLYEHASAYYRRAGLGLASRNTMECAAECWSIAGDETRSEECDVLADETEVFWEDEAEHDE